MRTEYYYNRNPERLRRLSIVSMIVGALGFSVYFIFLGRFSGIDAIDWSMVYGISIIFFFAGLLSFTNSSFKIVVDDEDGTIYNTRIAKDPIRISDISSITYKESKKGRFRSIVVHDKGTRFLKIPIPKADADRFVAKLLEINPEIPVRHANYI